MVSIPILVALGIVIVGLLVLRFLVKTVLTLAKVAILVAVGVAVWFGLDMLLG